MSSKNNLRLWIFVSCVKIKCQSKKKKKKSANITCCYKPADNQHQEQAWTPLREWILILQQVIGPELEFESLVLHQNQIRLTHSPIHNLDLFSYVHEATIPVHKNRESLVVKISEQQLPTSHKEWWWCKMKLTWAEQARK